MPMQRNVRGSTRNWSKPIIRHQDDAKHSSWHGSVLVIIKLKIPQSLEQVNERKVFAKMSSTV